MKQQHHVFIREFIRTGNRLTAYQKAYPDTKGESLRAAAARLYHKPHILQHIEEIMQPIREKALAALEAEATGRITEELCSMQQRRAQLAKIIMGKWQVKKHIRLNDSIVEVYDDPSANTVIRAIDLDSKLAANKYKEKNTEPAKKEPAPYVLPIPQANPDDKLPLDERLKKYPYGDKYWKGSFIQLYGADIEKFGFDTLDAGIPYIKGELTEAYKDYRFEKDVEHFKKHCPEQAREIFGDKPLHELRPKQDDVTIRNQIAEYIPDYEEVASEKIAAVTNDPVGEQWQQYCKLEHSLRMLTPEQLKHRENNFRRMRASARHTLLRPLLQALADEKSYRKRA